jgi:predicted acylesterase/phospholipase RssA
MHAPRTIASLGCLLGCLLFMAAPTAFAAADPCAAPHARSLVLSGGGSKGAFEAGAVYHLVVHRGCDFGEITGTSVGAINGALLAQAAAADDAVVSLANLRRTAEYLVEEWASFDGSRDVMRTRPLGRIRFTMVGLDSLADLEPLQRFIRERVELEQLASGRELRVGVTTFVDGRYREIVVNTGSPYDEEAVEAIISGSAVVPVFGRMVRAPSASSVGGLQLADGGLRHATPVTSYFLACGDANALDASPQCAPLTGADTPPHPRTEQLFVVVTSPFARRNDLRPVVNPRALDHGTNTITDGRQILVRTVDLLVDTMYRDDLDDMLMYNQLLAWHARAAKAGTPLMEFPLRSYNPADTAGTYSLPYEIVLVGPQREDADPMSLFDLEPATQRRQLFCGCIAADDVMQTQYGLADMADRCVSRFYGAAGAQPLTNACLPENPL